MSFEQIVKVFAMLRSTVQCSGSKWPKADSLQFV